MLLLSIADPGSLVQEKFRQFKELWRLDLSSQSWEELPTRGGPCARSGHRMAIWKNRMVMFGGFEDTGKRVRWGACMQIPLKLISHVVRL